MMGILSGYSLNEGALEMKLQLKSVLSNTSC